MKVVKPNDGPSAIKDPDEDGEISEEESDLAPAQKRLRAGDAMT